MKTIKYTWIAVLTLIVSTANSAKAQNWKIAPGYKVEFSSDDISGIFKTINGTIIFDEANPAATKVNINIEAASINTGNALMNNHAKADEGFDAAKYPEITFVSKKVVRTASSYQITADMTFHGITKEITFPFTFKKTGNSGVFSGKFNLNRSDYKVGMPGGQLAEQFKIALTVPVVKQ